MNAFDIRALADLPSQWNAAMFRQIADDMARLEWMLKAQTETLDRIAEDARVNARAVDEATQAGNVLPLRRPVRLWDEGGNAA